MVLTEVTGFESTAPCIEILDARCRPFYYFSNEECKRVTFNLPPGDYEVLCEIKKLTKPLRYIAPGLPIREKRIPIADHLDIQVGENKNKASIDTRPDQTGTAHILIDEEFVSRSQPEEVFIKGHECGHFLYKTEWKCDVFSAVQMLKNGYNPTQCYYANTFCLSDNQGERKDILFRFLKKVKCYE